MFTCKSPGGISYVWSPDGGSSFDCKAGKATCKGALTKNDANNLIARLCKQFPELDLCTSHGKKGIVVDSENQGIGIVTEKGIVRSLPSSIPSNIVEDAKESGAIAIVDSIDDNEDDIEEYVKNKAPPSTKPQQLSLLEAIRQGHDLKKTTGVVPVCDRGWYWSNKLGRCVSMNVAPNNQDLIREALQKKFAAMNRS